MDNEQQERGLASLFYQHATKHRTYMQYCDGQCQCKTPHTCTDKGLDEEYTCTFCGAIHYVRVR